MKNKLPKKSIKQVAEMMAANGCIAEWKELDEFPGYFFSDGGQIWSCRSQRIVVGHRCSQMRYKYIRGKSGRGEYLHRLICKAFHGNPVPPRVHVRHLDGNSENNRASNLMWGTWHENEGDKIRHGTKPFGASCGGAKLTDEIVLKMIEMRKNLGLSYSKIGKAFGVDTTAAHRAITGRTWQHLSPKPKDEKVS